MKNLSPSARNGTKGTVAALVANLIFGFSYLFTTLALDAGLHPLILVAARFTLAFAAMSVLVVFGVCRLEGKKSCFGKLALMALAQPFLYFILETYGLQRVSSSVSGVIVSLVPVAVLLGYTVFLRGKPSLLQSVCCAVSVLGVCLIHVFTGSGQAKFSVGGIALLLGAVLCAAAFNMLSSELGGEVTPFTRTYAMFAVSMVGFNLLAAAVLRKRFFAEYARVFASPQALLPVLYLSVVSSVVAFLLYNYATSNISMVRAASFSSIIPGCSVFAGVLILKERVSVPVLLCCAVILVAVFGVNRGEFCKQAHKAEGND